MKLNIKNSWLTCVIACAWCGIVMKFVKSDKAQISHGICKTCKSKHFQ